MLMNTNTYTEAAILSLLSTPAIPPCCHKISSHFSNSWQKNWGVTRVSAFFTEGGSIWASCSEMCALQ